MFTNIKTIPGSQVTQQQPMGLGCPLARSSPASVQEFGSSSSSRAPGLVERQALLGHFLD